MNAKHPALIFVAAALLAACQQKPANDAAIAANAAAIEELKTEVAAVKETANGARWVANMAFDLPSSRRNARLTPGDTGYTEVDAGLTMLALSLENVEPFASGTRITVLIGNPSNAQINQLDVKLLYGPFSTDLPSVPDVEKQKSKDWKIVKNIPAGSWGRHTVTLDGIKPEDFGYVSLNEVNAIGISLSRAR